MSGLRLRSDRSRRIVAQAAGVFALGAALTAPAAAIGQPASPLAGAPTRGSDAGSRPTLAPPNDAGVPTAGLLAPSVAGGGQVVRVSTGVGEVRRLSLPRGKSAVVELPVDARDVVVSNPNIAQVSLSTPRRIYVMGQKSGQTDAMFVDGMGRQILRLDIRVDQDSDALSQTLARVLPGASIHVEAANDSLILSGEAANAAEADKAARIAAAFVADPKQVINMIAVAGGEQVKLKVKFVEVNRSVIKQLGFNLGAVLGELGGPQYAFSKAVTYGVQGALLGGVTGGYSADTTQQPALIVPCANGLSGTCYGVTGSKGPLTYTDATGKLVTVGNTNTSTIIKTAGAQGLNSAQAQVQAFERAGLIRTLAEPELTATSGESAKFLAGGEFPVPAAEDNLGRVSVEFKQYGVGLGFTPIVLSSGRISLKVSTEVSEITNVGGFSISTGSGTGAAATPTLSIPGLTVRRAETVVELPSGGAMAIAGLLQSQTKETLDSLPGLMQMPIIGALLRSRDFENDETELVVIITPYLVKSVRPDQLQTPADGLKIASDVETNLLGRLNTGFGKPAASPPGQTYQGPFGYVVD